MNAEVLNARALTMRVGAVLAAFVLAFFSTVAGPRQHMLLCSAGTIQDSAAMR